MEIGATATALALSQALLKTPPSGAPSFERGQQFAMLVIERLDTQLFLLQVQPQGPMLKANAPDSLRAGQTVTLEVARNGDLPVLKLPPPAPGQAAATAKELVMAQATRQYLPRQQNLAHVQSRIFALTQRPDALQAWPEPVREALRRLAQSLPTRSEMTTAEGVARAIARSGIFAEQSPAMSAAPARVQSDSASPAQPMDIKSGLQGLFEALTDASADTAESGLIEPAVESAPRRTEPKQLASEPAANRNSRDPVSTGIRSPKETILSLDDAAESAATPSQLSTPIERLASDTTALPGKVTVFASASDRFETLSKPASDSESLTEPADTEPTNLGDSRRSTTDKPQAATLVVHDDLPKRLADTVLQTISAPPVRARILQPPGLEWEDPAPMPLAGPTDDPEPTTGDESLGQPTPMSKSIAHDAAHSPMPFIARTALAGHTAYALASRNPTLEELQLPTADPGAAATNGLPNDLPLSELHKLTEAGIAKIVMDQLASVPADAHAVPVWHCELPFLDGNQVRELSLAIQADCASVVDQDDDGSWQFSVEITPPGLGLIAAKLSGKGKLLDAQFWCASPATASLLDEHLEVLRTRLRDAGLDPRHLAASVGQKLAEPLPLPTPWAILDEHA